MICWSTPARRHFWQIARPCAPAPARRQIAWPCAPAPARRTFFLAFMIFSVRVLASFKDKFHHFSTLHHFIR